MKSLCHDRNHGYITCQYKGWESKIFKKPVYQLVFDVESISNERPSVLENDLKAVVSELAHEGKAMLVARFPSGKHWINRVFEDSSFSLTECYLSYSHDFKHSFLGSNESGEIREFSLKDIPVLEKLASKNLRSSRFHMDSALPLHLSDLTRSEWIKNSCNGRARKVWISESEGLVQGFLAFKDASNSVEGRPVAVLDLIAVDEHFRGKGIGKTLVNRLLKYAWENSYSMVTVGTQAHNTIAIRMYERTGFLMTGSSYSYHKHLV